MIRRAYWPERIQEYRKKMPRFYKRVLTKTLSEAVEEHLGVAPEEQINLFEELAITRVVASDAIALYSATVDALKDKNDDKAHQAREMAGRIVIDAMQQVSKVCGQAAQIEAQAKDKFSVHSLQHVVNQIIRIMHRLCEPDHRDIAKAFELAVRTEVKLPRITTEGTELTPDDDAMAMDSTVPSVPSDAGNATLPISGAEQGVLDLTDDDEG